MRKYKFKAENFIHKKTSFLTCAVVFAISKSLVEVCCHKQALLAAIFFLRLLQN